MRKFGQALVLAAILAATSACATITLPDGSTRRVYLPQVGVVVRVVNNTCAPLLYVETVRRGRVYETGIRQGESAPVVLVSEPFTGSSRQMPLIAKGYDEAGKYVGLATQTFHVSTYEGTRDDVWEVNSLRLPGGGGCR